MGWETRPRAGIGGSRGEWDQPLCWPPTMFSKEVCAGCAALGAGPQIPAYPPATPPRYQGFPGSPKKVYQGTAVFFKEPQVATFLTVLPHTRSPALLLFLPQTRHPATGLGALGGWERSQQPSYGLCSTRCDLSKWQKTPKNQSPQSTRSLHRGACAGCGARLPRSAALRSPSPCPGGAAELRPPRPAALPGKGGGKPKRLLFGCGGR